MFNKDIFLKLGGLGFIIGLATVLISYFGFSDIIRVTDNMGDRLAFGFQWMTIPVFVVLLGIFGTASTRITSQHADGSSPEGGTPLELNRRFLLNTLEQFIYFFVTQMALVTILPIDKLHVIPTLAVLFFVSRLIFWKGYFINPSYRSLGLSMNHINVFILLYIIFNVIFN